jgi:hypothetical protein
MGLVIGGVLSVCRSITVWVDAATTPYVETVPPKRFFDLVEATVIEADPQAAGARAQALDVYFAEALAVYEQLCASPSTATRQVHQTLLDAT